MKKNFWSWLLHDKKRGKNTMCMKLCLCLILVLGGGVFSNTFAQGEKLTLKRENASMLDIILAVEKQSGMTFVYSMDAVNKIGKITIDVKDVSIDSVMSVCLQKTEYTYSLEKNVVVIKKKSIENKTGSTTEKIGKKVISGCVFDNSKTSLPGVSVYIKGTTVGVVTDINGNYKIEVPGNNNKLVFSFVGMETKEVALGSETTINVVMKEEVSDLEEVTVVAYGERKKRELISSVSSVKAEDLDELPSASLETLLQGHMAGVDVSGSPGGGGTKVNIRGYNSLLTGEDGTDGSPLYVIDGVPVHSFTSSVTGTNTLAEIDPSTIESVEVLKDAASAALYGSRASNGVILITTKQGRVGRGKFTANVSYSYSILPKTPTQTGGHMERMANLYMARSLRMAYSDRLGVYHMPQSYAEAYGQRGAYEYFWNNGVTGIQYSDLLANSRVLQDSLNPFYNNSTNWWKYCFRAGKILNANLQTSGGTEHIKYMIGAGWYDETGIMLGSDFSRVNMLSNLTITPRKNLTVDARMYLAYTDRSKGAANTSFGGATDIEGLTVDPRTNLTLLPGSGDIEKETLKRLNETLEKNISYRIRSSLNLKYQVIKGLNISSMVSIDYSEGKKNAFSPSYLEKDLLNISSGSVSSSSMFLNENILSYNFSLKDRHNFDFLLGQSYMRNASDQFHGSGRGGPSDKVHYVVEGFPELSELNGKPTAMMKYQSDFEEKIMLSYFGRVAYNFDKKYLFEYTIRRDGSSVFGEDVRWATFPSVAAGWAFSEEKFMKRFWWLSYGKVRASWGTSGQQFNSPYLAHGLLDIGGKFMGQVGMLPTEILNTRLTWEESDQYDVGLDIDLFNYRLKFKLDYYYKYTKSMLYNVEVPGDFYFHTNARMNALEISNEGLEMELSYDILRETVVKWRGRFNVSRNWNRFEKSYTDMDMVANNLVLGRPIHGLYLYKDLGIVGSENDIPKYYSRQGNLVPLSSSLSYPYVVGSRLIQDMDGDGVINNNDKYYAGSTLPKAYGGWANEIRWKDFDLNVLFTFTLGRKMVNVYGINSLSFNNRWKPILLDYSEVNYWQQPGDSEKYPIITASASGYQGQFDGMFSSNVENVHYLRLKQLTLGYNFPKEWMNKVHIDGARLFLTAENLFLLTNYSGVDPEAVSPYSGLDNFTNYPLARKLTIGLTLNF